MTDEREARQDIGSWDDLDGLVRFMVEAHAGMGPTQHRVTNAAITLDGDRATARTYVDMVGMAPDGASGVNSIGWYDDELVRTHDGWRIARRRHRTLHMHAI